MRGRTLRFGLVVAATSWGRPALTQDTPESAQLAGRLEQSTLPALAARQSSAQVRSAAAESYFVGKGEGERAFPDYVDVSFGDPGALAARREILHRRALDRAIERVANPPAALSTTDA